MEPIELNAPITSQGENQSAPADLLEDPGLALKTPLHENFGAKWGNPGTDRQLNMIWDWAKETYPEAATDKTQLLWEIRKLSNQIGSPIVGEKPWVNLAMYVSTARQLKQTENRLKEMTGREGSSGRN